MSAILNCSTWKSSEVSWPNALTLEHVIARLVDSEGPGGAERAGTDVDAAAVEAGHGEA